MKLYISSHAPNPRRVSMFIAEKGITGIDTVMVGQITEPAICDQDLLIVGSGSGKTSLLKIVAGLDAPTSGTSVVDGRVQMVFQDPQGSLNPRLKIWKSIAEAMPGRPSKTEQRKRAAAALE